MKNSQSLFPWAFHIKNNFFSALILSIAFCLQSAPAAETTNRNNEFLLFEDIPVVVVTASKKAQSVEKAPANVYVITGEEMRRRGYTSVFDAIKTLPGMTWNSVVGSISGTRPIIRGTASIKHLKVLLNGMPLDDRGGSGFSWERNMPIDGIDRIEFILGPYSALYGRNTFAGVVNIVTKRGEDIDGGVASALYGEWDRRQASVTLGKKQGAWDAYFSLLKNYSRKGRDLTEEYPEMFSRAARDSSFNPATGLPVQFAPGVSDDYYLFWDFTDTYLALRHDCGLAFDFSVQSMVWPSNGTYTTPLFFSQSLDDESKRSVINSKISYTHTADSVTSISSLYLQDRQVRQVMGYLDGYYKVFRLQTQAMQIEQNLMCPIGQYNNLLVGLSYENVSALGLTGSDPTPIPQDPDTDGKFIDLEFVNVTAQDEIIITDNLSTVVGLMYEHANTYADILLPRITAIWNITRDTTVKLIYACGYVTPSLAYINDQTLPNNLSIRGSRDLDPEQLTTYEVNIIHHFTPRMTLSASAYLNKIDDVIYLVPNDDSTDSLFPNKYENVSSQETRGGELSFNWAVKNKISFFCSASYVEGFINTVDQSGQHYRVNELPLAADYQVKGGINILCVEDNLNLFIYDCYTGPVGRFPSYLDMSPAPDTGDYNVINVNLSTTTAMNQHWSLSLGINNLLDRKAVDSENDMFVFSGTPVIERRNWTITVSCRW